MERIGFIGLGIMGKPMAGHLVKAGHQVTVLSSSKSAAELKVAGASVAADIAALTASSDVLITMLPDSPEVESVVFGQNGILKNARKGALFIDMSTIAPSAAVKIFHALVEAGVQALDAPVSGGQAGAEGATLSIMVGGKADAYERAMPIFSKMGKNIVHIGEPGSGQVTKACNQVVVGLTIEAVAEALTLARKSGVDVSKVRQALLGGFANSKVLDVHGQRVIDRNFKPGFRMKLHRKDMGIALQTARECGVAMPAAAVVVDQMDRAMLAHGGDVDHSALALLIEQMSGVKPVQ
jgi:2-hydroxy-3-oxopropionate reductase